MNSLWIVSVSRGLFVGEDLFEPALADVREGFVQRRIRLELDSAPARRLLLLAGEQSEAQRRFVRPSRPQRHPLVEIEGEVVQRARAPRLELQLHFAERHVSSGRPYLAHVEADPDFGVSAQQRSEAASHVGLERRLEGSVARLERALDCLAEAAVFGSREVGLAPATGPSLSSRSNRPARREPWSFTVWTHSVSTRRILSESPARWSASSGVSQ